MFFSKIADQWNTSVAFKLGAATTTIVLLVTLLQSSVGLQTIRLSNAQDSILADSVPLLENTQEFARLTTKILGQTALLEDRLSINELTELRESYLRNKQQATRIFDDLAQTTDDAELIERFRIAREEFAQTNEQMFDNQFTQGRQERSILKAQIGLIATAGTLEDILDQMLVRSTKAVLAGPEQNGLGETSAPVVRKFVKFASDIEILNTLKGDITDIQNILQGISNAEGVFDPARRTERLRLRVRGITQSLTLLEPGEERLRLANLTADINTGLTSEGGLLAILTENSASRQSFSAVRQEQAAAIDSVDSQVELIVKDVTNRFEQDIALASDITNSIVWIGLATTVLVLGGIVFMNHFVIRKQISRRFITLTEDVLEISSGNYAHDIRVTGRDELSDIAKALDLFKRQAAELERSNAELEKFAYVAAHDLRSPLDAIQDLARWTLEDERSTLSESCIRNLELLIRRSARLSALQADLLTYAQVGDIDASVGSFDVMHEVAKMADMLDPDDRYHIRVRNDPGTIVTYALPTRQILINLITNAIKHHDRDTGQIDVSYHSVGGRHVLTVSDDGPGIEPRYQEKIFELFKTLQSRDHVEGSGLGLALVSKLADRLGGCVSVTSNAPHQRGTSFSLKISDLGVVTQTKNAA